MPTRGLAWSEGLRRKPISGRAWMVRYARSWGAIQGGRGVFLLMAGALWAGNADGIGVLDPAMVADFARQRVASVIEQEPIPGAVFGVVQGGEVVFLGGYGRADIATGREVQPDRTLFRVASISKLLTTAAVLQEVEAGRLDLDRNVNRYLEGFSIENTFLQPVTVHDLLTHTAGFATDVLHYGARIPAPRLALSEFLDRFQPERARAPGLFPSYDNYGFTLAGYLVQQVSGQPFAQRVRDGLLEPLGMDASTFLPDARTQGHLARGYWLDGSQLRPYPPDRVNILPAAGLWSTGADMARWMIALLGERPPEAARGLREAVRQPMLTSQFELRAPLPGRCYGFNRILLRGRPALRQTGKWPGYFSVLLLFPQQEAGLFLAYNLADGFRFGRRLTHRFVERFIPPPAPLPPRRVGTVAAPLEETASGAYVPTRQPRYLPRPAWPREIRVAVTEGALRVNGQPYRPVGGGVFALAGAPEGMQSLPGERVAFWPRGASVPTHLLSDRASYRRARWWETKATFRVTLGATLPLIISGMIGWPLLGGLRWWFRVGGGTRTGSTANRPRASVGLDRTAKVAGTITCAALVGYVLAWLVGAAGMPPNSLLYGVPAWIRELQACGLLLVTFVTMTVACSAASWWFRLWGLPGRIHYALVALTMTWLCVVLQLQHLLLPD